MQRILRVHLQSAFYQLEKTFDMLPDYAQVFGEDPTAAYTVLALAALSSAFGWAQLPKKGGLRYLSISQLIVRTLIIFMCYNEISHSPVNIVCELASIVGLVTQARSAPYEDTKLIDIAGYSYISAASQITSSPGLKEISDNAMLAKDTRPLLFLSVLEIVLPLSSTIMLIILLIIPTSQKDKMNAKISSRQVGTLILTNTIVTTISQFG